MKTPCFVNLSVTENPMITTHEAILSITHLQNLHKDQVTILIPFIFLRKKKKNLKNSTNQNLLGPLNLELRKRKTLDFSLRILRNFFLGQSMPSESCEINQRCGKSLLWPSVLCQHVHMTYLKHRHSVTVNNLQKCQFLPYYLTDQQRGKWLPITNS